MSIPNELDIINSNIKIEYNKNLFIEKGCIGYADYQNNKIILDNSDKWKCTIDDCFYHELTHWILFKMGSDLEKDEHFVGLFGDLLHQALKSSKYYKKGLSDD